MWVFDGEEWIKDDGSFEPSVKSGETRPRYDESLPELQVIEIEIVPVTPKHTPIPPFPLP